MDVNIELVTFALQRTRLQDVIPVFMEVCAL